MSDSIENRIKIIVILNQEITDKILKIVQLPIYITIGNTKNIKEKIDLLHKMIEEIKVEIKGDPNLIKFYEKIYEIAENLDKQIEKMLKIAEFLRKRPERYNQIMEKK